MRASISPADALFSLQIKSKREATELLLLALLTLTGKTDFSGNSQLINFLTLVAKQGRLAGPSTLILIHCNKGAIDINSLLSKVRSE